MSLNLINLSRQVMPRKFLARCVRLSIAELAKQLTFEVGELTIVFTSPQKMRVLNRQYRKKDFATDVLSFGEQGAQMTGDLVICPSVIAKQALEHEVSYQEELSLMVVHGLLHLLGFDHEKSKRQARIMFELQDGAFRTMLARPER